MRELVVKTSINNSGAPSGSTSIDDKHLKKLLKNMKEEILPILSNFLGFASDCFEAKKSMVSKVEAELMAESTLLIIAAMRPATIRPKKPCGTMLKSKV